jgi:CheY-like chemotaxis protein
MTETLVLAELRNLRRYAFCILGNRYLSDMAVEAALDKIVSKAAETCGRSVSRLDLYRQVNAAARTVSHPSKVSATVAGGLYARFLRLTAEQRQVSALRTTIGLSYRDIASIMNTAENEARRAYIQSLETLRKKPMAVLIIEDEVLIARELYQIVTRLGLSVAGTACNRTEALRIAGRSRPQLILADYQLRGDTGVEVVKAIREHIDTDVIYVTAHPDAVAASRETSRDIVITKPFSARAVERAVQTHLAA